MSVNLTQSGSLRSIPLRPAVATAVIAYQSPAGMKPYLLGVNVANTTGSAVVAQVTWFSAKDNLTVALLSSTVGASTRLYMDDVVIALQDGDRLEVTSATASSLDFVLTVMERHGSQQ